MGVLCCHFRPKMFSPGDHVRYHSRTLGAHVLATVVGPSPTHPVPVMQTEHVQQFKVCYSRTQKFFTVPLDPQ